MAEARDSGICVDNENDSMSSSATSSTRDINQSLSSVQRLRKCFENLAKEQELEFHSECNWWLDEEVKQNEHEEITETIDVRNEVLHRNFSTESETRLASSKQALLESQASNETAKEETKLAVQSATSPNENPYVTFTFDNVGNNETNDSDSFDSDENEDETAADDNRDEECTEPMRQIMRLSRPISNSSQTSNVSSKLQNILRELIENEENYVKALKKGIENYVTAFERKELPKTLKGKFHRIFGNIKSLYNFHRDECLPALIACADDPEQIAEVFTSFITKEFFYAYIIYAMNRKRSELLCNHPNHVEFWKKVQNQCGDRLGINSFLLQPIQRLPRYQLLMNEIIKDLSKDLENTKQAIAVCCVAEKNMQRLITQVNESIHVKDIKNCFEIDILCQGKFRKIDDFDIYDWEIRRRFRGKVFIFERCVVYTEALDREHLEYRGHFGSDQLGIIYKEGKSKFKLFARKRGQKEVEFRASLKTILEWNEMITAMLMKFVMEEKQRNASRKTSLVSSRHSDNSRASMISTRSDPSRYSEAARASLISTKSDQSFYSIGSYRSSNRSSSGNSSIGRESSYDARRSQWFV